MLTNPMLFLHTFSLLDKYLKRHKNVMKNRIIHLQDYMFGNIQPIMKKIDYIEKFYAEFFNLLKKCNLE